MPERSKQVSPPERKAKNSTSASIPSTPLRGSRWQVITAGAMLAIWIAFLIAMAFYN